MSGAFVGCTGPGGSGCRAEAIAWREGLCHGEHGGRCRGTARRRHGSVGSLVGAGDGVRAVGPMRWPGSAKGNAVHVAGRLERGHYTGRDGADRESWTVLLPTR